MTKNGMKVLDSDMHLMEPVDLWDRYIDSKFKAMAPRGLTSENVRDLRMAHPDGRAWGVFQSQGVRSGAPNRGQNFNQQPGHLPRPLRARLERRSPARSDGHRRHRCRRALSDPRA